MDANYANDIAPAQAETQLHILERAAAGIGVHVNADKIQRTDISRLNVCSQKLVDKFTYLGSSVSSSENDKNVTSKSMDSYR